MAGLVDDAAAEAAFCDLAQRNFFSDHLSDWVASFATGLQKYTGGGYFEALGRFLAAWIPFERHHLGLGSGTVKRRSFAVGQSDVGRRLKRGETASGAGGRSRPSIRVSQTRRSEVMDFGLSEQQQKWHDAAVRFGREELVDPDGVGREQRGEFWREGYERCGKVRHPRPAGARPSSAARGPTSPRRSPRWRAWATAAPTPG